MLQLVVPIYTLKSPARSCMHLSKVSQSVKLKLPGFTFNFAARSLVEFRKNSPRRQMTGASRFDHLVVICYYGYSSIRKHAASRQA